jgi:class 3 adenylate cyclase/tetratricopeptide (TPR) repeat protein
MEFYAVLDEILELLRRRGRVTYRALKRQFNLDDEYLEDLKAEIIKGQRLAVDEDGEVLVWVGEPGGVPPAVVAPGRAQERVPLVYTPPHLMAKILASRRALEGERKQVTVLFADIQSSTELIQGLDPEEARQLLDPAIHLMMEAVHRYEGTVNQVLGDGIMALFGAPVSHEDHAVRACYAALAMQDAMRHYGEEARRTHGITVQLRVGLNSGEVVVRTISNDLHMDYSAVGQTTHLAARMEQLATPGTIMLTATTLRLVEGLVRVQALGPVPVKGLSELVEVFELVGASAVRGRLQVAVARGLTRFVGRQTELEALHQALERVRAGHGQVVAIVGEAGVGKSRLVYEVVHSHRTQDWLVLESTAVSYGKATPYFPVLDLLKRYAHVEHHDEPRTIRAKVTGQVLTLDATLQDSLPALLELLEVLPEESPFRQLDPLQQRRRTLNALKRVLLREGQEQPLLLVCEDLHWIDTETQALLDSLVESLPTARLLLLVNYRPEYQHGWQSKLYYTQLQLDPLPPTSASEFLQALLGDDPSLVPLKQLLFERTGGNPFFLEESVRTLVETGVLVGERGAYRLAQALLGIQVPATVQAVLAARIDRLPPEAKSLLQTAAVIGTEIPFPLLQAIAELSEPSLHGGLAHLQEADFLDETRLFPELAYTFKHTLTHEVAYGSLLQERRRALHTKIVTAIEQLYPDRLVEQVDRLAHHALRGEVWEKALPYCRQAGGKAMARSAHREAVMYFEQALGTLSHLPEGRDTHEQAFDLRLELRNALLPLGELRRVLDLLHEAETLAEELDDAHRLGRVSLHMTMHGFFIGDHDRAIATGQRALSLAKALGDGVLQSLATYYLGSVYYFQGAYHQAIECNRWTVAALTGDLLYEPLGQAILPAVMARSYLARSLAEVGTFSEASVINEEGFHIAEEVGHPLSLMMAHFSAGLLSLSQGDLHKAVTRLEQAMGICQDTDLPLFFSMMAEALGAAYTLSGQVTAALPLLTQAVERAAFTGRMGGQALRVTRLGEAYLLVGRLEEAGELAAQALSLARTHKERGNEVYALRLLGEVYTQRSAADMEPAEAYYRQALTLAEALDMRPLQAHCHLGLGTLYGKLGQSEEARAALSMARELYCALDMTLWLPQVEAALAQVQCVTGA